MSDEFDSIIGDIDDELDLTLYADSAELAEEVTVQVLAAIEKGLKLKDLGWVLLNTREFIFVQ